MVDSQYLERKVTFINNSSEVQERGDYWVEESADNIAGRERDVW